jgi:hypothetical protein
MGVAYGLYASEPREYIRLGKRRPDEAGGEGFQLDDRRIVAFLARHAGRVAGPFTLLPDTGELPDDSGVGWTKVDDWCRDDEGD